MAKTNGPVKIKQYSLEFKLKAVQLSNQPGVLIKDVAESLCVHPFMLSRWRKQVRDGELWAIHHRWNPKRRRSCNGCGMWKSSSGAFRWSTIC